MTDQYNPLPCTEKREGAMLQHRSKLYTHPYHIIQPWEMAAGRSIGYNVDDLLPDNLPPPPRTGVPPRVSKQREREGWIDGRVRGPFPTAAPSDHTRTTTRTRVTDPLLLPHARLPRARPVLRPRAAALTCPRLLRPTQVRAWMHACMDGRISCSRCEGEEKRGQSLSIHSLSLTHPPTTNTYFGRPASALDRYQGMKALRDELNLKPGCVFPRVPSLAPPPT